MPSKFDNPLVHLPKPPLWGKWTPFLSHPAPSSANLVCLQVCQGLLLLHFPCGFRSRAPSATWPCGLLSVWPIQSQALCHISSSTGCCPVCLQSSLRILPGHQIRRMFLKLILINICNFCFTPLVSFQVSEPYKGTTFTFYSDSQVGLSC